jgi:release factor glutamine methyltransferase
MINANSIKSTLLLAATLLKAQDIEAENAKLEAQLLLQHVLNVNRAWLIAHEHENVPPSIEAAYRAMLERRLNGEPIAYILGYREFYGLKLKVTADTLIPRADTETLVEAALAKILLMVRQAHHERKLLASVRPELVEGQQNDNISSPSFPRRRESMLNLNQKMDSRLRGNDELSNFSEISQPLCILDLGTGSGAIALAIAKHCPQAHLTALDASQAALDIAIENSQNLKITNVKFVLSDWFSGLKSNGENEKFDIIVSNPPYIEAADTHLKQGDLRFEPLSALASGADGLDAIRTIITQAQNHLNPHGWLMLEHGYNQAEVVAALLKKADFSEISHAKDLAGINRVTLGRL